MSTMPEPKGRVLVGKVGLDGHDRGVKVVARTLRDAGYEVIYSGLFQTPESLAATAVQEDVDAVGLSILSGAHNALVPKILEALHDAQSDIPIVVGGTIPPRDVAKLLAIGVAAVLGPGAGTDDIVRAVSSAIAARPA